MKKTNINYPHPVLSSGNEDYLNSSFDVELIGDISADSEKISITAGYMLNCKGLEKLIAAGKAKVSLYFESILADYRKAFSFDTASRTIEIEIKKDKVSKSLIMKGYITAIDNISPFNLEEHNKEVLGSVPFILRKGDVMAIAEHHYTIPLENYDPLADKPSIFIIRKQTINPKEPVSTDFSEHKISVYLNEEMYNKYQKLYEASDIRSTLASLFAVPVLVDALNYIRNLSEDEIIEVSNKKWYQVVMHRIKELNIDLKTEGSLTKVANMILPNIFSFSIDALTKICKDVLKEGESDET